MNLREIVDIVNWDTVWVDFDRRIEVRRFTLAEMSLQPDLQKEFWRLRNLKEPQRLEDSRLWC